MAWRDADSGQEPLQLGETVEGVYLAQAFATIVFDRGAPRSRCSVWSGSASRWDPVFAAAEEATLSSTDRELLTDWLVSKFGPDSKPFPRTYIPPEIKTFFSDPEAQRLMNRACTRCHGVDRIQSARKAEEGWRVTLVDMRERGAQLSDEELERLVEWLTRVWGTNQDK